MTPPAAGRANLGPSMRLQRVLAPAAYEAQPGAEIRLRAAPGPTRRFRPHSGHLTPGRRNVDEDEPAETSASA